MASLALGRHILPVGCTDVQRDPLLMTAPYLECVAEEIQRPLISLTSADIGTDPESVEEELLSWFELARVWSAVLLLDEADVFLERRSASDLVRNNLVAIFLRTLEYYKGILFLTTNRIGTFDEAFLSRIDVPIYFPPLSKENRVKIWNTFFTKLEKERQDKVRVSSDVKYYIEEDRDLLSLEWNGREIRSGSLSPVPTTSIVR
jgi:SpoVK/Ycf46/Vps4 family AAA+-type ATPase